MSKSKVLRLSRDVSLGVVITLKGETWVGCGSFVIWVIDAAASIGWATEQDLRGV